MKNGIDLGRTGIGVTVIILACSSTVYAAGPVAVAPAPHAREVVMEQKDSAVLFSMSLGSGYLTGESTELVYWPEFDNHVASELTWDIDNLFMVGIGVGMVVADRFEFNFSGWFKATDGEGSMDDYDWQVPGADWTDWSHHEDTDVTDGSIIDLSFAYSFIYTPNIALKVIGGYKHDNFGWEARGGDYTYSVNGFRDYSGSFPDGVQVVSYEQTMSSLYGGLGVEIFAGNFNLAGRFIYAPWVQADATDYHHLRNLVTYDEFDEGDMIAFDLSASYSFTTSLSMQVGYSYQYYDTVQGDSEWHYNDIGVVSSYPDGAGMDQKSSLLSVAVQYSF